MTLEQSGVLFDKESHQYFLNGKQLQGITGMLRKRLFPMEYAGIPQEILDNAARRGTDIHEACEAEDNGTPIETEYTAEVEAYSKLKKTKKLNHLASEYIVTDGYHFASAIDKVYKVGDDTVDLGDIKTTSTLNKEYVSWQLSIYAYFFETMNPQIKVRKLYALHIRNGKAKLTEVQRVPQDKVLDLLADEVFDAPIVIADKSLPAMPDEYASMQEEISEMIRYQADIERRIKELKAELLERMDAASATKWEGGILTFTRKADSSRETFDTKRFKEDHPELYKQYTIITNTRGSVTINLKK